MDPTMCQGSWPNAGVEFDGASGGRNLISSPAQCTCSCTPPIATLSSCSASTVVDWFSCTGCMASCFTTSTTLSSCNASNGKSGSPRVGVVPSSCGVDAGSYLPPPGFQFAARTCTSPNPLGPGCPAGQYCPPPVPSGGSLCIVSASTGITACPSAYASSGPFTYYSAWSDGRSCSQCNCRGAVLCGGTVGVFAPPSCNQQIGGGMTGGCFDATTGSNVSYTAMSVSAVCDADGGAPSGAVMPAGTPYTYCCR